MQCSFGDVICELRDFSHSFRVRTGFGKVWTLKIPFSRTWKRRISKMAIEICGFLFGKVLRTL